MWFFRLLLDGKKCFAGNHIPETVERASASQHEVLLAESGFKLKVTRWMESVLFSPHLTSFFCTHLYNFLAVSLLEFPVLVLVFLEVNQS